jgi:hypothetical protein
MAKDGWRQAVIEKLPLAESVLHVWSYLTDEVFLSDLFERHRGRSYRGVLSFESIVGLVGDALLEHGGSGRRAIQQAERQDALEVSMEAVYAKLRRVPQTLSHGFLAEGTQRLRSVRAATPDAVPASLRDFEVLAVDGKKIKHAAKRLVAARKFRGSVLGGKTLVALCLRTQLAVAMSSHPDGETNDPPLVPDLLRQVRTVLPRTRLYVLDRQFCDLKLPKLLTQDGDHFLVRYHQKVTLTPDSQQPPKTGKDRHGREFTDQWGWLGRPDHKGRLYVRCIHLKRPGEKEDLIVITDLLDRDAYPADDLLELYRQRWGIERVFQQITEVFHLRHLIASTPEGTIFQCAFCLLLYNLLQVQRSHLADVRGLSPDQISLENVFYDAQRQLIAWNELLGTAWTARHFEPAPTAAAVFARLRLLLTRAWKDDWLKAPLKKHWSPPTGESTAGGHTSIYRLTQKSSRR